MTEEANENATTEQNTEVNTENNGTLMNDTGNTDWYWSEGVKGEGDKPDFLLDKYKTVDAQAKAYPEAQKKMGSFVGSPETYEVQLSDEIKERGFEMNTDHPMYEPAVEWAKELNMNQDGFNSAMNMLAEYEISKQIAEDDFSKEQIEALGGQERIDALEKMGMANLPEDMHDGFRQMFRTKESVEAGEYLLNKVLGANMSPDESSPVGGITKDDVDKMQFELTENKERRIHVDPEFRKEYERKRNAFYGTQEHKEYVR